MSVTRTDNSRWRAIVKHGRSSVASKTFDLKRDADTWYAAKKRALELGEFVDPKAGRITLAAATSDYLAAREGTVSAKTLSADRDAMKRLPSSIANRPIASLRASDFEAWYTELLRKHARGSVTRTRDSLSALFTWAVRQRIVSKNPVRESKVPSGAGTHPKSEIWPYSLDELRAVAADIAALREDKDAGDIVMILGLTGLRWGELAALRVRDVQQLPTPALRVSRSKSDGVPLRNMPKSGKPRTVPMTTEAWEVVSARLAGRAADDLLFPSAVNGFRLLSNFKRASSWASLSRGRRIHDLRHTAATLWLSNGVDLKTAQTWLGHSTAKLTADTYAHWLGSDADAAAIAKLNAALGYAGGTPAPNLRAAE